MSEHTPGPWGWFGNEHGFYLATPDRGRQYVMGFRRMGMRGAQPTFQKDGRMVLAQELVRFEVDPSVIGMEAGKAAESVYRYDIIDIDHPDAQLIAAAPETAAELERAREDIAELVGALTCLFDETEGLTDTVYGTQSTSLNAAINAARAALAKHARTETSDE